MRNYFTFDNTDSRTFGVFLARTGVYDAPKRAYKAVSVPGRNGDIYIDTGRMENIKLTYPAVIYAGFDANIEGLRSALCSRAGYKKITDSYHPDEYRLGFFVDGLTVTPNAVGDRGEFSITFNCKPQRFLNSGDTETTYASGDAVTNPTLFNSKPLIRVYGSGTLSVGSYQVTIASHSQSYIDIDSDIEDCYCGTTNMNSYVTLQNYKFPELAPGANGIEFTGITSIKITPRWFIA